MPSALSQVLFLVRLFCSSWHWGFRLQAGRGGFVYGSGFMGYVVDDDDDGDDIYDDESWLK